MAQMNIDLNRLSKIGQEDLSDAKTQKRLYQYLFQLSEQLKYFQYHVDEENLTADLQANIRRALASSSSSGSSSSGSSSGIVIHDEDDNETVTAGQNGDILANSVTCEDLTVGGYSLGTALELFLNGRIVVSDTQPAGHGIIWLDPQTSASGVEAIVDYKATGGGQSANGTEETVSLTFTRDGSSHANGDTCQYGIRLRVYNESGNGYLDSLRVTVTGEDENGDPQTVTLSDESSLGRYVGKGDMITIDTLADPSVEVTNVTYGSSVSVSVYMQFSFSGQRKVCEEAFLLRCFGEEPQAAEVRTCTVKYIT